ncbi:hypothetical protein L3X38_000303 [Prunus dulcis]|uniref:Uncharacterized protein n=1 Tax=Prunus dulcis TaxID=3755 RepID=A0AAD4UQM4_PRUDU|nr:hypothetical protein L3X38_000303 [Prunus dulcis]
MTPCEELLDPLHIGDGGFEGVVRFALVDQCCGIASCWGGVHSGSKGIAVIMVAAEEESLRDGVAGRFWVLWVGRWGWVAGWVGISVLRGWAKEEGE